MHVHLPQRKPEMALRLKCSQIFGYVGAVRARGTEGSATFRPARQAAHRESIILCSGGSNVAAKSCKWRLSAGMRAVINVARPVSFEIEREAISRLQETSVALIHLEKCLFLFRTDTRWFPILFVLVEAFTRGNIPQCTCVRFHSSLINMLNVGGDPFGLI